MRVIHLFKKLPGLLTFFVFFFLAMGIPLIHATEPAGPRFVDRGDGTLSDSKSGLLWARKDSWVETGKCLTWPEAVAYAKNLNLAGHTDWRLPTMDELAGWPNGIVERSKTNSIGVPFKDWQENHTLHLDEAFAPSAYWLWSSEADGPERAGSVDLRNGQMVSLKRTTCFAMAVRPVRKN